MPIYLGNSTKNKKDIIIDGVPMSHVYVGENLVWQKIRAFTPINNGALYNGYTAIDSRNIAPIGWHVITKAEWDILIAYLGGADVAGGKLKESGLVSWLSPNTGADNSSGLSVRGSSIRNRSTGSFATSLKAETALWTSTPDGIGVDYVGLAYNSASITTGIHFLNMGFSMRLICDSSIDPGFVVDPSGFVYPTIKIGNQVLTKCNIRTEHFRNGEIIPLVTNNDVWAALGASGMCYYNNDINNV